MILGLEIAMVIMGIAALATGRLHLSKQRVFQGTAVRFAGVVLLLPLPICLLIGFILGFKAALEGRPLNLQVMAGPLALMELMVVLACLCLALAVAFQSARPPEQQQDRMAQLSPLPADVPVALPAADAPRPATPSSDGSPSFAVTLGIAAGAMVLFLLVGLVAGWLVTLQTGGVPVAAAVPATEAAPPAEPQEERRRSDPYLGHDQPLGDTVRKTRHAGGHFPALVARGRLAGSRRASAAGGGGARSRHRRSVTHTRQGHGRLCCLLCGRSYPGGGLPSGHRPLLGCGDGRIS
jgi:hypothetical protein